MNTIELAHKIAAELGAGWTPAPSTTEHCDEAYLRGPGRARLILQQGGYAGKPGMVAVEGCFEGLWSCIPRRDEAAARHGINVSVSKSPERIAAEIGRRLLPTYLPILAAAVADKARQDVSDAEKRAFEDAMAALLSARRPVQGYLERISFGDGYGHGGYFRVTGDTVLFEFRLPRARALDLAEPLAAVLAVDADPRADDRAA